MTHDRLLELEHAGWRALCDGDGGGFYGRLMTDDGVMLLVNGAVLDRGQVADSLAGGPTWDDYVIQDARRVEVGDDAAALVYLATANRAGNPSFRALMASTYRVVEGAARLALYQQTAVDE